MRTVRFKPTDNNLEYLHKMNMASTRDYRNLHLDDIDFTDLTDIKVNLLETAEKILLVRCLFQDFMEFKKVLDFCQNAIEFKLFDIKFGNLKYIPKEKSKNKEDNEMVRPVKCSIDCTDWRVLQCFDHISELDVGVVRGDPRFEPSVEEKLFLFENYAHTIKSIDLDDWTNDELLLLLKKGQLRSIQCWNEKQLKFVLDDICQHLHNLETFTCGFKDFEYGNFNKLKTLKKLRSLTLCKIEDYKMGFLELDITELTLTELTLDTLNVHLKILKKFSQPPMTSMKKLQIHDTNTDQEAINAIISLMPNLEYVGFYYEVSLYLFVSIFYLFIVYFK
jgi:hypothetical protein